MKYALRIEVEVSQAAIAEYNRRVESSGLGLPIPEDPSEWDETDFSIAMESELATFEITDGQVVR